MTRRTAINSIQVTVGDVWDYYETTRDKSCKATEVARRGLADAADLRDPRLFGKTLGEIERLLDEADKQASLFIIAAAEAAIRVDFENRVMSKKPKDSVTKAFRRMATRKGQRVRLEDILDVWSQEIASTRTDVSQFKGALGFRHWLAHGRWWAPKLGHRYDPAGLFLVIESLLTKTGLAQA